MFRHLTVLLLIATAWPLRVFAADPLSLADAVRIAAEQAPRLDASAAAIAAAEADASRAGALPDPRTFPSPGTTRSTPRSKT